MRPNFQKYDLVSTEKIGAPKALVVKAPYKKGDKWAMVVNFRLYGRYSRYEWHDTEVDASKYILIERGFIGRIKNMTFSKKWVALAVLLLTALFVFSNVTSNYNLLVRSRNKVDNTWSKVETQYQKRLDLIDNVVQSVKGSQFQEQEVFGEIAQARSLYGQANTVSEKVEAANNIDTAIAFLPKLQEAYPELRSNDQVSKLIAELQSTESNILSARNEYNDNVTEYNNSISVFPMNVYANMFNFETKELFKSLPEASQGAKVNLNEVRR